MPITNTKCCGVKEFTGLADKNMTTVMKEIYHNTATTKGAFYLFSDVTSSKKLDILKRFIERKELGTVFLTDSRKNLNSPRKINALLWGVDYTKFDSLYKITFKIGDIVRVKVGTVTINQYNDSYFEGRAIYKGLDTTQQNSIALERLDGIEGGAQNNWWCFAKQYKHFLEIVD